jgi:hypothetical protein
MYFPNQPAFSGDKALSKQEWLYAKVLAGLCANPTVVKLNTDGTYGFDEESLVLTAQTITAAAIVNFNDAIVEPDDSKPELLEWNTAAITTADLLGKRHPDAEIRAPQARR